MESNVLKTMLFQSTVLLCFCLICSFIFAQNVKTTIAGKEKDNSSIQEQVSANCSNYIKIAKKTSAHCGVSIEENPIQKEIELKIQMIQETSLQFFKNTVDVSILGKTSSVNEAGIMTMTYTLKFSELYVFETYQDDNYIYIGINNPRDVYDRIIIIDTGHGGMDSGTQSSNGRFFEKNINLSVTKKLKTLFDKEDTLKVFYTRLSDEMIVPQQRLAFINEVKPDLCVSIHCNSGKNTEANGIEVLYNKELNNDTLSSKMLAENCLSELVQITGNNNRGLVDGENIYIIRKSSVPIALLELGFLSNKTDLKYIVNESNHEIIAQGIYNGIMKSLESIQ